MSRDLPDDLAHPRRGGTRGVWVGIVVGGALMLLDGALLAYALLQR